MKILKPKTIDFEDKKDDMNCSIGKLGVLIRI